MNNIVRHMPKCGSSRSVHDDEEQKRYVSGITFSYPNTFEVSSACLVSCELLPAVLCNLGLNPSQNNLFILGLVV